MHSTTSDLGSMKTENTLQSKRTLNVIKILLLTQAHHLWLPLPEPTPHTLPAAPAFHSLELLHPGPSFTAQALHLSYNHCLLPSPQTHPPLSRCPHTKHLGAFLHTPPLPPASPLQTQPWALLCTSHQRIKLLSLPWCSRNSFWEDFPEPSPSIRTLSLASTFAQINAPTKCHFFLLWNFPSCLPGAFASLASVSWHLFSLAILLLPQIVCPFPQSAVSWHIWKFWAILVQTYFSLKCLAQWVWDLVEQILDNNIDILYIHTHGIKWKAIIQTRSYKY